MDTEESSGQSDQGTAAEKKRPIGFNNDMQASDPVSQGVISKDDVEGRRCPPSENAVSQVIRTSVAETSVSPCQDQRHEVIRGKASLVEN